MTQGKASAHITKSEFKNQGTKDFYFCIILSKIGLDYNLSDVVQLF